MSTVKRAYALEEEGLVARIDKHVLPDLDDVLRDVYAELLYAGDAPWLEYGQEDDEPTRLSPDSEAIVRHFRMDPCSCYDRGHGWHLGHVHEDEDGMPDRPSARGAWLGVYFR